MAYGAVSGAAELTPLGTPAGTLKLPTPYGTLKPLGSLPGPPNAGGGVLPPFAFATGVGTGAEAETTGVAEGPELETGAVTFSSGFLGDSAGFLGDSATFLGDSVGFLGDWGTGEADFAVSSCFGNSMGGRFPALLAAGGRAGCLKEAVSAEADGARELVAEGPKLAVEGALIVTCSVGAEASEVG